MTAGWHHADKEKKSNKYVICQEYSTQSWLSVCVSMFVYTQRGLCQRESGPVSAGTDNHGIRIFRFS